MKTIHPKPFWLLLCILALASPLSQAQMKVGNNPGSLASDANLQVEASNGAQVVVRRSTGQVGIGTTTPANRLEVNSGTSNASGVRLTQLTSASVLATNASGDVVKGAACTCGDIKASILSANHGDWQLMNGSQSSGSCGVPSVDARNTVLAYGGTAGTVSAAAGVTLTQANLPSAILFPESNGFGDPVINGNVFPGQYGLLRRTNAGDSGNTVGTTGSNNIGWTPDVISTPKAVRIALNPGTQVPFSLATSNLPRLNVNMFVCVN